MESGLPAHGSPAFQMMLLEEVDLALRPPVHERRVPSTGTFLDPQTDAETWCSRTQLEISHTPVGQGPIGDARRYVDGFVELAASSLSRSS